jgi:two-component system chemotaxis response regulator CheB
MIDRKKIKVLVVDDSVLFREMLSKGISSDPDIEVVGKASDPYEARDKILELQPDVMTCDVEMPKMSGIEFVRKLMPQYPLPVIMISTVSNAVFDAMNAGAVDFVTKPDSNRNSKEFTNELIFKIKIASKAKVISPNTLNVNKNSLKDEYNCADIIAIGASTGGTEALYNVLKALPSNLPGIVVVQHIPPVFSRMFAERLDNQTSLRVKEAVTGDYTERGTVIIAPGDRHIAVKKIGDKYRINCIQGEKVNGHCPSADVLFESVAKEAGNRAIGIILTGMGCDGAKGLLSMKKNGAYTIGQDEASSVVYGMPKVAFELGAVIKQTSLNNIPQALLAALKER